MNTASKNLTFKNKHFSFTVAENGEIVEIINLYNGENANDTSEDYRFIYLTDFDGQDIYPVSIVPKDDIITVTFENSLTLDMRAEIFDDFMTFELVSELDRMVKSVTFANLKTVYSDGEYLLNAVGMTAWTNPIEWGYRIPAPSCQAKAFTIFERGMTGAKLGIVFSTKEEALPYLKQVVDAIDIRVGLTSKAGGPYAREWKANFGDYALITNLAPDVLEENLKLAREFDIDQYDVHQSPYGTFCQGDFRFVHTEHGLASEHRETAGKRIEDAGMIAALHTYAYYVDINAHSILSNPKWQAQLHVTENFTLSEDIDGETIVLPTVENASGFDTSYNFLHTNMSYVLVDEEIIKIVKAESSGLTECIRGCSGTAAVPHKKGAVLKHLGGVFGMFTPVLGSELFYHIADLTAKAYNEGGFNMIYFDAIDGAGRHIKDRKDAWYYHQMFIHRVLSQCERTPLIETSAGSPQEWNFRGRVGAWDYANFSIKKHINNHATHNINDMQSNMCATLGWFCFYPDEACPSGLKNTVRKTLFHDDMDYLGKYALAYDMSIVFHPLSVTSVNSNPFHHDNIEYYTKRYTKLRKSHYFKDSVLERVRALDGEWRVIERGDGYALQQMYYEQANLGKLLDSSDLSFKGKNPFGKQTPFIRVEARYSTLFEEPLALAELGSIKPMTEDSVALPLSTNTITDRIAMTLRVKGTGNENDAALISLSGGVRGEAGGRLDHFISLGFEGWREFILLDVENAQYDTEKFPFHKISTNYSSYDTYRFTPPLNTLKQVAVRVSGETADKAEFGTLTSFKHTPAPIKNPSVTVNGETVTFDCELHGGDYVEYDPVTSKALLYHNAEQTIEEIAITGKLAVEGEFTATYSAQALSDAPLRARVTLGFIGEELSN
ncbi:MAG: hypothetical protein IKV53_06635 [Clostridia bacterium]|nr:hypothetical protein [Clostridia bacterium]